jgi:hypothetical protein
MLVREFWKKKARITYQYTNWKETAVKPSKSRICTTIEWTAEGVLCFIICSNLSPLFHAGTSMLCLAGGDP